MRQWRHSLLAFCSCVGPFSMPMKSRMGLCEVLREGNYDSVLLDQFGVIHDGKQIYPQARNAIVQLNREGIKIVILSNSSKKNHQAYEKLERMGIERCLIHDIVTSGQLADKYLTENSVHIKNKRILHINWGEERGIISLREHGITLATKCERFLDYDLPSISDVDIILCHGTDGVSVTDGATIEVPYEVLESYVSQIGCQQPSVLFVCANPDFVTVDGPNLRTMPGSLARAFEKGGGKKLLMLGKPYPVAYDEAIERLKKLGAKKFLAVGDSLAHDVLGAFDSKFDIDTVYIAGGIDADYFGLNNDSMFEREQSQWHIDSKKLNALISKNAPELGERLPNYVLPFFRW